MAYPKGEQQCETIYTTKNRKCSAHRYILPIVQRDTVAIVIVVAFMYQLSCPAVLLVTYNRYFALYIHHLLTVRKYPFTIPFIFWPKRRGIKRIWSEIYANREAAVTFHTQTASLADYLLNLYPTPRTLVM